MALHRANALPTMQAGIRITGRAEIDPDVLRAKLIAAIDINLVNIEKEVSLSGLIQFLMTTPRAVSCQACG